MATCCDSVVGQGLAFRGLDSGMTGRLVGSCDREKRLRLSISRSANLYFLSYSRLLTILLTSIHASIWACSLVLHSVAIPLCRIPKDVETLQSDCGWSNIRRRHLGPCLRTKRAFAKSFSAALTNWIKVDSPSADTFILSWRAFHRVAQRETAWDLHG